MGRVFPSLSPLLHHPLEGLARNLHPFLGVKPAGVWIARLEKGEEVAKLTRGYCGKSPPSCRKFVGGPKTSSTPRLCRPAGRPGSSSS